MKEFIIKRKIVRYESKLIEAESFEDIDETVVGTPCFLSSRRSRND